MLQITHHCNQLRESDVGQQVALRGWIDRRRDHGGVIFTDLRDREGKTQVVFNPDFNAKIHEAADKLRNEFVIHVKGEVKHRPEGMVNPKMDTGAVDVYAHELLILSKCLPLPISINDNAEEAPEGEDVRLKFRYLDMRRPRQQRLIKLKSDFLFAWRKALHESGFLEVETPILMKSTPEGARDFLVPSRLNPGKFYALPQSPQTYKQLLMVAGCEKYYQIAKCFRDEDLRADRQPEFLQIDCEMSFVECEDIYAQFEKIFKSVVGEVWGKDIVTPFRRIPYSEAMLKYGSDKPDLRYGLEIHDVSEIAQKCDFKVFREIVEKGGVVRGLAAKGCVDFTRKIIDDLTAYVGKYGSKGLVWMRCKPEGVESQVGKFFKPEQLEQLREHIGGEPGDMLFFIAGKEKMVANAMGQLRVEIARKKELTKNKPDEYLWVTDFPMFEYSETEDRFTACHHPFTSPQDDQMHLIEEGKLDNILAKAYDMVLNGVEIGGGSIRIHRPEVQQKVFKCLGMSEEQWKQKFGYFVEAFQYGPPPHGGLAFGVDRVLATLESRDSIRDFIPFPKTSSGISLLENCPSEVDAEQLQELHIQVSGTAKKA
ncbi:MAG: aspartate--tRNA ligase [Fibrobacteria bacterium]|nr:aspartate--tRNA ligase [Fibrobacteria bacterium]